MELSVEDENHSTMKAKQNHPTYEANCTSSEQIFLKWLLENGASFPKVQWPSISTVGGIRGAVASENICGGDTSMICIPLKLIISPVSARKSKTLGFAFKNQAIYDDLGGYGKYETTLFLMHETLKGCGSFWYPYIQSLPEPSSVTNWNAEEVRELQNPLFTEDFPGYAVEIEKSYKQLFELLHLHFPGAFDKKQYTFQLFRWAYLTVQVLSTTPTFIFVHHW